MSAIDSTLFNAIAHQADPKRAVESFLAWLTSNATATQALRTWCSAHGIGNGAIEARVVQHLTQSVAADKNTCTTHRARRVVALVSGDVVVSTATLDYNPDLLNAAALRELNETARPFGDVIAPLKPTRHVTNATIDADILKPSALKLTADAIIADVTADVITEDGAVLASAREAYRASLILPILN
ncbi:MAG: hypothetical protein AAGG72_00710 [Pseudomonadota bacterium]